MRLWAAFIGLLCALGSTAPAAQAQEFVVIVNKANPTKALSITELRRIFMKQSRMWPHADAIVPVDWDAGSPIRQAFSERIMKRSVREMAEFWVQETVTRGGSPPSTQRSARAILRFVASVPGAISYVAPGDEDDSVVVIKVSGLP